MYRIAVVDDEAAVRASLQAGTQNALQAAGIQGEVCAFASAEEFLAQIEQPFHMVLLDIQMDGMDGMACAEKLRQQDQDVIIIFITSMVQYAVQGYRVDALDYIVKPVTDAQLESSLNRAFRRLEATQPKAVTLRTNGGMSTVHVADILYVEAVNHRAVVHTKVEEIACSMTLSAVESLLAPYHFFRCHAAFLVNLSLVERVTATDVIVAQCPIPVSKHRRRDLMQAITAWWGKKL